MKKLTKDIVTEAIQAYAEDDAYWLKLYQFADAIDISVLDKLEAEDREEWDPDNLLSIVSSIASYVLKTYVLKTGLLDFFQITFRQEFLHFFKTLLN